MVGGRWQIADGMDTDHLDERIVPARAARRPKPAARPPARPPMPRGDNADGSPRHKWPIGEEFQGGGGGELVSG